MLCSNLRPLFFLLLFSNFRLFPIPYMENKKGRFLLPYMENKKDGRFFLPYVSVIHPCGNTTQKEKDRTHLHWYRSHDITNCDEETVYFVEWVERFQWKYFTSYRFMQNIKKSFRCLSSNHAFRVWSTLNRRWLLTYLFSPEIYALNSIKHFAKSWIIVVERNMLKWLSWLFVNVYRLIRSFKILMVHCLCLVKKTLAMDA